MNQIKSKTQIKQRKRTHRVWTALALCVMALTLGACGKDGQGDGGSAQGTRQSSGAGQQNNVEHPLDALQSSGSRKEEGKAALPEAPASDFEYKEADGKITIKRYTGKSMEIAIPAQIEGKDVTAIGDYCFANSSILKVACPSTLETIEEFAFANCYELKRIDLNEGLQTIGKDAFLYCKSLDFVRIPDSVAMLGEYCFSRAGLTHMEYLASAEELPQSCFSGTDFQEVVIPGNIKKIGTGAFASSEQLKKVIIEDGVESIGKIAIAGCPLLTDISIPASVTEIAEKAFSENSDTLVLTVQPGSYAESYAKENNIAYVNP